jgi:hypothetical protein
VGNIGVTSRALLTLCFDSSRVNGLSCCEPDFGKETDG